MCDVKTDSDGTLMNLFTYMLMGCYVKCWTGEGKGF